MNLPTNYDSWRLDNDEPTHFTCPECGEEKEVEDLAHNDEMCTDCYAKKIEDELNLYGEAL